MKDVLVHIVADDDLMDHLSAASKLTPAPGLLFALKEAGIAAALASVQVRRGVDNVDDLTVTATAVAVDCTPA